MDSKTKTAALCLVTYGVLDIKTPDTLGKIVSNVLINDVFAMLAEKGWTVEELTLYRKDFVDNLHEICLLRSLEYISHKHVRHLLSRAWDVHGLDLVSELVSSKLLDEVSDETILEIISDLITANPKNVTAYKNGKTNIAGFFVGQTLKKISGKGDPAKINKLVKESLDVA